MVPTSEPSALRRRPAAAQDLTQFCLAILERGDLESKLAPAAEELPPAASARRMPALPERPARERGLEMRSGAARLPGPDKLHDPAARALCLARFAHHELMAVELFAWALLRWPGLPGELQRDWLRALDDEQRHCALYLERLEAHGQRFEGYAHSDYFWQQAPAIAGSEAGPAAFLAAMGLTLEQANLDFTLLYRDAFRAAGDDASARVCEQVHEDEIEHVRLAERWLRRLCPEAVSDRDAYLKAVPFPLSAARAKGRHFREEPRFRAGLDRDFIEFVRSAPSTTQAGSSGRSSDA